MALKALDLSASGWTRVLLVTVGGTIGCIAAALYVDSFSFMSMTPSDRLRSILVDIFLPSALAGPLLFFFMSKLRELAITHRELSILASTDSLTAVLNRGAFTMLVDAYLRKVEEHAVSEQGALLIVDADHFKAINDSYGHASGDIALRIIAQAIKGVLRGADIVGRIGGEEFGVFLPGSTPQQAEAIAERIREAILDSEFIAEGAPRKLTVSVGGASFERAVLFTDLYRMADQRLYLAKQAGRNRIALAQVPRAAA